jgi:hypothetical protein
MLATGMPLTYAIGTSLVAVTAFGATTAANYAVSGLVDWRIAGLFILGAAAGGAAGMVLGKLLGRNRNGLRYVFSAVVIAVGIFIVWQGASALG